MDYDGDQPYYAFNISHTNQLSRLEAWEPGLARVQRPSWPFATADYFHTDHLGTTRYMSRDSGNVFEPVAYSAFGEQVSGVDFHFYGYAGAWGYRANYGFPFLHVGARYYDPAAGRFLQRDPIGISGGHNVYNYVFNRPTAWIDPSGLRSERPEPFPKNPIPHEWIEDYWPPIFEYVPKLANVCANWYRAYLMHVPHEKGVILCFLAGTPVHTHAGTRHIETLTVGTHVLARADGPGMAEDSHIESTHVGWATSIVEITLVNETIRCTAEHPFWRLGHGWIEAGRLVKNDLLLSVDSNAVAVLAVRHLDLPIPARVYNLSVSGSQTYYVGETGILVHNKPR
jgi:RHS repeat-associated protein